jgi:DNA-directed RNA polymerase specialized sigma24 family protein
VPKTRRLSDAALVRRSQQGDRRSFSALLGRYDWRLRGLAHALLLDENEMDVALGTAYLRAWRDVVRIGPRDDVAAWLYRVTYNACIDQLRRSDGQAAPASGPATSVTRGLAALSPAARVAVVLVDREGFSPASAARIMGLPHGELVATLEQARDQLTSHLPEAGTVRPGAGGSGAGEQPAPAAFDASAPTTVATGPGAAGVGESAERTGGDAHPDGAEGAGESATAAGTEVEADAATEAEADAQPQVEGEAQAGAERALVSVGAPGHAAVDREGDRDTTGAGAGEAGSGDGVSGAGGEPVVGSGDDVAGGNGASGAGGEPAVGSGDDVAGGNGASGAGGEPAVGSGADVVGGDGVSGTGGE